MRDLLYMNAHAQYYLAMWYTIIARCGKMASCKVNSCRFCSKAIAPKHCTAIFSPESLSKNLPERLSALLQLPVISDDGHPLHCCRPCMRSFLAAECFVASAKQSYESRGIGTENRQPSSESTTSQSECSSEGMNSAVSPVSAIRARLASVRKRMKDTTGPGTSPSTFQSQPLSKRCTGGLPGRRLAFTPCERVHDSPQHVYRFEQLYSG